ncbi:MAG TPA: FtsQ-type POTRA domain-containing protein [Thermoanaerobaculia bacterium]|nr:FtsQ-type POTRA domain-containing protein [Thermoanaerobaculia bacterium]
MSSGYESARFLRPPDVGRIRRNQRRIQAQRVLMIAFNVLIVATVALTALWAYRRTQSDSRFAVKAIEIAGATHTPRAQLDAITKQYTGLNLFRIDIARVQHDLGGLPWVSHIAIEKKLPDTLRILIVERTPVALAANDGALRYVDPQGIAFADLSPTVGDSDLPVITHATGAELVRSVRLVADLRAKDPEVFSRISEIRPIAPNGFALFDRQLGAFVYANGDDLSAKWRSLYSIVQAEHLGRADIEYADLRFNDRIVVKPVRPITAATASARSNVAVQITN